MQEGRDANLDRFFLLQELERPPTHSAVISGASLHLTKPVASGFDLVLQEEE